MRGVLSALGAGLEMTDRDVAARINFATRDGRGNITDRRAGRISSAEGKRVVARLDQDNIATGIELVRAAAEIGGYGPVKEASVTRYGERLKGLLEAFEAPDPAASALRVQMLP